MARIRSLNGLPNEITQMYLSTLRYYDKGYMMDWIAKRLMELKINSVELDLYSESSTPINFISNPIKYYFKELRKHITKTLVSNGFDDKYISQGIFKIHISNIDHAFGKVSIQCILTNIDNHKFVGKVYSEKTYPIAESLFEKIIKKLWED